MASYTIPEEITGIPLFVPDLYDQFTILEEGLPNGDDCLTVFGNLSQSYKAYQATQVLVPNLFRTRYDGPWAVSFWFKGANIPHGTDPGSQVIFGVQNCFADGGLTTDTNWTISCTAQSAATANRIRFHQRRVNPTTSGGSYDGSVVIAENTWVFCVLNHPLQGSGGSGTGATAFIYTRAVGSSEVATSCTNSSSGGGSIGTALGADQMFCVGAYSNVNVSKGRLGQWYIGKLSFHNHELTLSERQALYNAMTA